TGTGLIGNRRRGVHPRGGDRATTRRGTARARCANDATLQGAARRFALSTEPSLLRLLCLAVRLALRFATGPFLVLLLAGLFTEPLALRLTFGLESRLFGLALDLEPGFFLFPRLFVGGSLRLPLLLETRALFFAKLLLGFALASLFLGFA